MEVLLIIIGFAALLVGLVGAVLPLPGPPLSFIGLLILQYTERFEFEKSTLVWFGLFTAAVFVFDYYAPIWGVKKFGGTKQGSYGSTIGMVLGFLFLPPIGIFVGAFVGAFVGELTAGTETNKALKAATGSFLGFMAGIVVKVAICLSMLFVAIYHFF